MLATKEKYGYYLQTDCWKLTRQHTLWLANYICAICYARPATQAHHKNGYACVGCEDPELDLIAVCGRCHRWIHGLPQIEPKPIAANDNQLTLPLFLPAKNDQSTSIPLKQYDDDWRAHQRVSESPVDRLKRFAGS